MLWLRHSTGHFLSQSPGQSNYLTPVELHVRLGNVGEHLGYLVSAKGLYYDLIKKEKEVTEIDVGGRERERE